MMGPSRQRQWIGTDFVIFRPVESVRRAERFGSAKKVSMCCARGRGLWMGEPVRTNDNSGSAGATCGDHKGIHDQKSATYQGLGMEGGDEDDWIRVQRNDLSMYKCNGHMSEERVLRIWSDYEALYRQPASSIWSSYGRQRLARTYTYRGVRMRVCVREKERGREGGGEGERGRGGEGGREGERENDFVRVTQERGETCGFQIQADRQRVGPASQTWDRTGAGPVQRWHSSRRCVQ